MSFYSFKCKLSVNAIKQGLLQDRILVSAYHYCVADECDQCYKCEGILGNIFNTASIVFLEEVIKSNLVNTRVGLKRKCRLEDHCN